MVLDRKKTSATRWRDWEAVWGLIRLRQGYGATRCCAQLGAYVCFCETNPPFFWRIYDVTFSIYGSCGGKAQINSVGSFWKTNPLLGVFGWVRLRQNCILAAFSTRFSAFAQA